MAKLRYPQKIVGYRLRNVAGIGLQSFPPRRPSNYVPIGHLQRPPTTNGTLLIIIINVIPILQIALAKILRPPSSEMGGILMHSEETKEYAFCPLLWLVKNEIPTFAAFSYWI